MCLYAMSTNKNKCPNMNTDNFVVLSIVSIMILSSCTNKSETDTISINFKDFPLSEVREDTIVSLESPEPLIVGATRPILSGYMMYLYDNDNLICLTDTTLKPIMLVAPKGMGPTELTGVSGIFGQLLEDGDSLVSIFDPYKSTVYALNTTDGTLQEYIDFPNIMAQYTPFSIVKLKNGEFISPRGDFRYGMIAYDSQKNIVKEWPIGLESVDVDHPDENHVSMRAYDYNPKSGLIAEIYGIIPAIIVHDESGSIVRTISITDFPRGKGDNADYFRDICMTDEYILVLCGDPTVDEANYVIVLTHAGAPVASYKIRPTHTISFDSSKSKLITINPEIDGGNIAVYGPFDFGNGNSIK